MPDPAASPVAPAIHETHVSIVFLVGDRAAKLKKAVRFPFVDLSTRAARERICHREVELNRRLAPDVYLGVFDLLDPDGSPCDHLVMMRRMPDDRRLASLVRTGAVPPGAVQDLAHLLASFHLRATTSDAISTRGVEGCSGAPLGARVHRDPTPPVERGEARDIEDEIEHEARIYLQGRERLFEARREEQWIRDGHGDLLADDVFLLDDGPRVLDCLEFDDELRYGDVLADVAFLAMDLERLGSVELASELLASHRSYTGDSYPATLAHHYIAMRAHIRAKVAALRDRQVGASAGSEVDSLLSLTAAHLRRGRVTLALVGGAPGSGKSTLAAGIADALGWTVLRSDEVRKDLAGIGHLERSGDALDRGIYSDGHTRLTYEELVQSGAAGCSNSANRCCSTPRGLTRGTAPRARAAGLGRVGRSSSSSAARSIPRPRPAASRCGARPGTIRRTRPRRSATRSGIASIRGRVRPRVATSGSPQESLAFAVSAINAASERRVPD